MSDNPLEPQAGDAPPEPDFSQNALHKKAGGNWDKANNSYFNAVTELGKTHEQLNAERAERTRLESMLQAAFGGKQANPNPFAELETLGIAPDGIEKHLTAKTQALVDQKLSEMLGPIVNQMEAEEKLASEIENFDQHKAEARAFMKKNAEVGDVFKAIVATNPVAAWKYAIKETLIEKQAKGVDRNLPPRLPDGRFAPKEFTLPDNQPQLEADAAEYLRKFGDAAPYRAERFKGTSVQRAVRDAMRQLGYQTDERP